MKTVPTPSRSEGQEAVAKHKRARSEDASIDVAFERALMDWILKHRARWLERQHPKGG